MSGTAAGGIWRRSRGAGLGFGATALIGMLAADAASEPPSPPATSAAAQGGLTNEVFRNGEAGFVVTDIGFALGPDAKDSGACPLGMTIGVRGQIAALKTTPAGQRKPNESQDAYERRLAIAANTLPDGRYVCMNPEASKPDPGWRLVSGRDAVAEGIDLDGQDSTLAGKAAPGTCRHQDFRGANGERGIDNQFYRMAGCTSGYQSTGMGIGFKTEMLTGSWGILVSLKGVDDLQNDDSVEVGIYANADPIQLSPAREALPYATYAVDQDPRFRATTRGRIVDGVLVTDPVDVRFHNVVNAMYDERVLRHARLKMRFAADGGMQGFLAGYSPVDATYDLQYGSRSSKSAKGELMPLARRIQVSIGRADALGHSCNGAYHALKAVADGDPDPVTGECTSVSTQYRIRVAPAFVVDVPTESVNRKLARQ